jgi:hypothetical protein
MSNSAWVTFEKTDKSPAVPKWLTIGKRYQIRQDGTGLLSSYIICDDGCKELVCKLSSQYRLSNITTTPTTHTIAIVSIKNGVRS